LAGSYDLAKTFEGSGTWVITGGTRAYAGLRGQGTCQADAARFPFIRHAEVGQISLVRGA
jgi:hypothetical protein